jgi:Carboxypeptidase regulatory-like domain/Secretion system C-terminal sorting domain
MLVMVLILVAIPAFSQMTGSFDGTVSDVDGNPIEFARVALHSGDHGGGHGGGGMGGGMMGDYETWTNAQGEFILEDVTVGEYEARAMLMGAGMVEQDIEILANQTLTVEFFLDHEGGSGGQMGGHWMHDWEPVELHGWTIVEENDVHNFYYLDEENDGVADYQLGFGPVGYIPPSDVSLPLDGDEIDIVGGIMNGGHWMNDFPMVMVFELNGFTWFEPTDSSGHHNGHGGGWHNGHGCTFEEPVLTAAEGWTVSNDHSGTHSLYWLNVDDDPGAEFRLDFGGDDYNPGNGAMRPELGDWVEIVGGLIDGCPVLSTIIVYEINGMLWRVPGDTTGMGPENVSIGDEPIVEVPANYLIVDAYPNPFNPTTNLNVSIPSDGILKITVFDVIGREITAIDLGNVSSGLHNVSLGSKDWAAGVYFVRVEAAGIQTVKSIHLVK